MALYAFYRNGTQIAKPQSAPKPVFREPEPSNSSAILNQSEIDELMSQMMGGKYMSNEVIQEPEPKSEKLTEFSGMLSQTDLDVLFTRK